MKLLCSDFDGTLSTPIEGNYSNIERINVDAVNKFVKEGNHFALVTGRNLLSAKIALKSNGVDYTYLLVDSGAYICDNKDICIFKSNIDANDCIELIKLTKSYKGLYYELSNGLVSSCDNIVDCCNDVNYKRKLPPFQAESNTLLEKNNIVQYSARFKEKKDIYEFVYKLEDLKLSVIAHINGLYVDITSTNINKSKAIEKIAKLEKYEEIYTIGDGLNDYEMIKDYYGFAIESGCNENKEIARHTVKNIKECIDIINERKI